jgi:hypothetical protein
LEKIDLNFGVLKGKEMENNRILTPFEKRRLSETMNHMKHTQKMETIASVLLQKPGSNIPSNKPQGNEKLMNVTMNHNTIQKMSSPVSFNYMRPHPLKRKEFELGNLESITESPPSKTPRFETPSTTDLLYLRIKSDSSELEKRETELGQLNKSISLGNIQLAIFENELEFREAKTEIIKNEVEKDEANKQLLKLGKLIKIKKEEIENSLTKVEKLKEEIEFHRKNFQTSLKKYNEERISELK